MVVFGGGAGAGSAGALLPSAAAVDLVVLVAVPESDTEKQFAKIKIASVKPSTVTRFRSMYNKYYVIKEHVVH